MPTLDERVTAHEEWLASVGARGARLDLTGEAHPGVDLVGRDLSEASLDDCDLSGASLRGAWLVRTALHGTRLDGADLEGAHLRQAEGEGLSAIGGRLPGGRPDARVGQRRAAPAG